ncbi:hypothetical protein SARC_00613 [Sphaeroforma arctica JP610]|uniref:Uncharacterized protein n=1 Tax=Sphaeroforma arctica JP610 TaxID=667725 RepID=A0A0L0GEH5_9EUKA|nr:hypothetical protein SARC_00613 [Sphaeroforma arctica JP610]KNC87286.1 hypothetical protein SARC_00613 [Sphaeroforma arctica JP610]|eukprot:XP_014161188.1 hypothetical protein SARC_00613 [Sphaeroforma arctica JP610]
MSELCLTVFTVYHHTAPSGTNPKAAHVGEYLTPPPTYTSNFRTNECHKLVTYKGYMEYAKANEASEQSIMISIIPELKGTWNPDMVSFLEASGLNIEWLAHEFASQMVNAGFSAPLNDKWELAAADGSLGIMQTFDRRVAKIWKEGSYSYLAVEYMWSTSRSRNESQVVCNVIEDCGTGDVVEDLLLMGVELLSPAIPVLLGASGHLLVESQASKDLKEIFNTISSKLKQVHLPLDLSPFTLDLSPTTLALSPYTLDLCPFTLDLIPFTLDLRPSTLALSPFTLDLSPLTLDLSQFTLDLSPSTLDLSPSTLDLSPFTLDLSPFTLDFSPFTLDPSPSTLDLSPFTLDLSPFTLDLSPST